MIPGSGTDLSLFDPAPVDNAVPRVILPARMLYAKGVAEFVDAAKMLLDQGVQADFVLMGDPDPANPASVPEAQLCAWDAQGAVRWEGYRKDIAQALHEAVLAQG